MSRETGRSTARRPSTSKHARRAALVAQLHEAARAHSTATVLLHEALNERRGLSATEGKALDLLARLGPLTASQLVEHTGLAPASVTELVDRLEAKGFVRRHRDTEDRRRVRVEIDAKKLGELAGDFERFGKSVDTLWDEFSDAELEVVRRFLVRAAEFVREAATSPGGRRGSARPRSAAHRARG